MGKDYYGYLGVNKASGGTGKRKGGGSGKPLGGGDIRKAYHKQPEKKPRISKEAERSSDQSSGSHKVLDDPPRRPVYDDKHTLAEEKPKGKPPLPAAGGAGHFPTGGPWLTRHTDEADASGSDVEVDCGLTDDTA